MDFKDLILRRESCRSYTGEKVSREQLDAILEAGRLSPSACNSQPWSFYVVSGDKMDAVRKGVQSAGANKFADKAAAFIVVFGEKPSYPERVGATIYGRDFSGNDIGMTVVSMAYAAADVGLGTCIVGAFNEKAVKEGLGLDKKDKRSIKLILVVGVPAQETVRSKSRKQMSAIAHFVD